MRSGRMYRRIVLGGVALGLWIFFFACGIFVETIEYRVFLAPHAFPKHVENDLKAGISAQPFIGSPLYALIVATTCFTPTNLAFLALLGGFLGGCSSNIYVEDIAPDLSEGPRKPRQSFLEESPWSAMMRSFIVYLCIIAGMYFVVDDPFKDSTPAQYVRLAGTVSVMSLLVGFDPSRILPWLSLVDRQQNTRTVETASVDFHLDARKTSIPVSAGDHAGDPASEFKDGSDSVSPSSKKKVKTVPKKG